MNRDQLQSWIRHNVSTCARSMFVFDEMDNMPAGIIDVLTPFLGQDKQFDGVDFRKSVFIFLSNTGGSKLSEYVLDRYNERKQRNSITLEDLSQLLEKVADNEKNGLMGSKIIKKNLIDQFIPFLPLEEEHVRKCIKDYLQKNRIPSSEGLIVQVLSDLKWESGIFSKSGCSRVGTSVNKWRRSMLK